MLEATLPVSDLVGLVCDRELFGGLGGGGAVGLTGLVVAMLAGLLDFVVCGCVSFGSWDVLASVVVGTPNWTALSILFSS